MTQEGTNVQDIKTIIDELRKRQLGATIRPIEYIDVSPYFVSEELSRGAKP